jgi:hypothetical protein
MLMKQVQLLEDEFMRQNAEGYDDEIDNPIVDLSFCLRHFAERSCHEVRKNSRFNYSNKGQFLRQAHH